ncbi:MAG TPA: Ig-like domain repeat protein [Tepidisphaeraceae bacterium]|jgi:uncharacterized repeat protein (TIGR01451 family)|nr:Ig-like domain repeat protein [Tepidisphaeraceae bacterium]
MSLKLPVALVGFFVRKSALAAKTAGRQRYGRSRLIDSLEQRLLFSAIVVNTTAASGAGSLAAAIASANTSSSDTTITFDPTAFATPQTITLTGSALSLTNTAHTTTITGPSVGVTIDAGTLSGVFTVASGVTASISELGITGGSSSGITNNGSLTLSNDIITGNENITPAALEMVTTAPDGGGIDNAGSISLANCTISNNKYLGPGNAQVDHGGGGIYNGGTATITDCTFNANSISDVSDTAGGGAIYNGGTATLADSALSGNGHITGGGLEIGGGIYNSGNIQCVGDAIVNNNSYNDAGGVENTATASFTNCTIAANFADGAGGGIRNSAGNLTLAGDTISQNNATAGGNGVAVLGGTATISNTIIAGNIVYAQLPGGAGVVDVEGAFTSLGHNLIGVADGGTGFVSSDLTGTAASPLNADLDPLANYGGSTQTMPPAGGPASAAGSVALIPAGITTDQRGLARTVNGMVDIGAVEQQAGLTISNVPSTVNPGISSTETFTVIVSNTSGSDADNVAVSDLLPSGLTYVSSTPSVGTYDSTTGAWTIGTLASGTPATLTIVSTVTAANPASATTTATLSTTSTNGNSALNVATQSLNIIAAAPTLANDSYTTPENTTLTVDAAAGVLDNDTPAGSVTITTSTQTAHGTLSFDVNDGSFTYTPDNNFQGTDTFTYSAQEAAGGAISTATVTITVGNLQATTTTLTTSNATAGQGDAITLIATIAPTASGSAAPTGMVVFSAGATTLGAVDLASNGTATLTTTALPLGTTQLTATYQGDTSNAGSTSSTVAQSITAFSTPVSVGIISHKQHRLAPFTLANGTVVNISVNGGSGTVAFEGNEVDLTLSGSAAVNIRTKGGADSLTLSNVTDSGKLNSLVAGTANLTGTLSVAGRIGTLRVNNITGTVISAGNIATLNAGDVSGTISAAGVLGTARLAAVSGVVAAARINTISATTFSDAQILAGVNLGSDGILGGIGSAADTYSAGQILALHVAGTIIDSVIVAGANPGTDDLFGTTDDTLAAGSRSKIGTITSKGTVDAATRFESGTLPKVVHIPGKVLTSGDARFVTLT